MRGIYYFHVAAALGIAASGLLQAQNEDALRRIFEGRQVTVKLDMPADVSGVDVYPEREYPVDYRKVGDSIRHFGVSLRQGDTVTITKIHLKDKYIEFQLGGGGYGTFTDVMAAPGVPNTSVPKSRHEKDLEAEREVAEPDRRRRIDDELDDLRRRREREQARLQMQAAKVRAQNQELEMENRTHSGSRFNIRFQRFLPADVVNPEGFMNAMSPYVDFSSMRFNSTHGSEPVMDRPLPRSLPVRKGMSEDQVNAALGRPLTRDSRLVEGLEVVEADYRTNEATVSVQFVNGVVTNFRISGQ